MSFKEKIYYREPILLDIRKNSVLLKRLREPNYFDGPLYIWETANLKVACIGRVFKSDKYTADACKQEKVFYENEDFIISETDKVKMAMKYMFNKYCGTKKDKIKPIVICNSSDEISSNEELKLEKICMDLGAREFILLHEKGRINEQLMLPNERLPYKVIKGNNRFVKNEQALIIIISILVITCFSFWMSKKFLSL
jgi:hypothetical protein